MIYKPLRKFVFFLRKNIGWLITTFLTITIPFFLYNYQFSKENPIRTETFYFSEFSLDDKPVSYSEADCWTQSLSTQRSDALRCSVEDSIFDPCFLLPLDSEYAVCPADPHNPSSYAYIKVKDLPDSFTNEISPESNYPWYIILENSGQCIFVTGATFVTGQFRMDYSCGGSETSGFLFLPITQNDKMEKFINCNHDNRIEKCKIREEWY